MKASAGDSGGNYNQIINFSGFNKFIVRYGYLIENVKFFMNNQQIGNAYGGGGNESTLECVQGKIVGFDVRAEVLHLFH
jgi:hypothetical protein